VVRNRQDLDLPANVAIDDRERKSPHCNSTKIRLARDPELLRIAADALHCRAEARQIASAESLTTAFVKGDLCEVFRFSVRVKEVSHRKSERAFFSTSSDEINCAEPESICSARRCASANQTRSRSDSDNSSRLESSNSAKRARSSGGRRSTSFSRASIFMLQRYHRTHRHAKVKNPRLAKRSSALRCSPNATGLQAKRSSKAFRRGQPRTTLSRPRHCQKPAVENAKSGSWESIREIRESHSPRLTVCGVRH
jgi:hypothetical protein